MQAITIFLIVLIPIPGIVLANIPIEENNPLAPYKKLANCALFVTKRYISSETNNLVIKGKCSNCKDIQDNFNLRLLEYFLQNFDASMTLQLFLAQGDENPWNHYIFIVDNIMAFNDLRFHIPYNQFEREFYFLIILTVQKDLYHLRRSLMLEIFRTCVQLRVLHVVIMTTERSCANSVVFFTYMFSGKYCGQEIEIIQINRFRNGTLEQDFLFPPQLTNFNGCTLNVTAFLFVPWLGFVGDQHNVEHTSDVKRLTGIEGDHLKLLARILNFKVNLHFSKYQGAIKLKENSTGAFADLETRRADIALGCLSAAFENFTKLSSSTPYRYSPSIFVVRSDLHFGPLEHLLIPFRYGVWFVIGSTILLAFAAIKTVNFYGNTKVRLLFFGPKNHYPNTNLLTVLLGNPVIRPPHQNFARFLLMSWLILTLVLRNAYQGKLFDSLRTSRRAPIPKGIEELIAQGYKLLSFAYVDYYPRNLTIIGNDFNSNFYRIQHSEDKLTVASSFERLGYFNFVLRNKSQLSHLPEQVFLTHISMFFQRHSVLKLVFDTKIKQLIYSGITKHSTTKRFERKEFQMMNVGSQKLSSISNEKLEGLYVLYLFLIAITILCFVLEVLTLRYAKLMRFFDQVHYESGQ